MPRLADVDVDEEADKLMPKATELAKSLGHASVIARRGTEFFVSDSWLPIEKAAVVRMIGSNGAVVRV